MDGNTNLVATLMTSRRLAVLPDRTFSAGMRFHFTLPPQSQSTAVDGDIDLSGKITPPTGQPKSINATMSGVLNDSIDGDPASADITIKGKVSRDGTPFDGGPFGL